MKPLLFATAVLVIFACGVVAGRSFVSCTIQNVEQCKPLARETYQLGVRDGARTILEDVERTDAWRSPEKAEIKSIGDLERITYARRAKDNPELAFVTEINPQ